MYTLNRYLELLDAVVAEKELQCIESMRQSAAWYEKKIRQLATLIVLKTDVKHGKTLENQKKKNISKVCTCCKSNNVDFLGNNFYIL